MSDLQGFTRRTFVGTALAIAAMPAAATPLSLERLIARNTLARGGARRLNGLRSMASVVRVTEPTFRVLGRYLATADGLVRVDVYADGKRVFSEGVDSVGVWAWPGAESSPKPSTEKGKAALLHSIEFNLISLGRMKGRGHRLAFAPEIARRESHVIQLTQADGFESRLFVSPESWLVVGRQDRRAYHPDVDSTEKRIESQFSDFRAVGGIVSPFLSRDIDLDTGKEIGRAETLSVQWNVKTEGQIGRNAPPPPAPTP